MPVQTVMELLVGAGWRIGRRPWLSVLMVGLAGAATALALLVLQLTAPAASVDAGTGAGVVIGAEAVTVPAR